MKIITKTLSVGGMTCAACSSNVEHNVSKVEGVNKATANLATKKLTIEYDPEQTSIEQLAEVVDKLGFEVEQEDLKKVTIPVEGMS